VRIGAYQFAASGNIDRNMSIIRKAVAQARAESVRLLAFPECALTGYPPEKVKSAAAVDFLALDGSFRELQRLSDESGMFLLVGSVTKSGSLFLNSAVLFQPGGRAGEDIYGKRALWGWDLDNFVAGAGGGVWEIDGFRFGARICYEVRFPEFFRELYREKADFAVVMFSDVSEGDDQNRYDLIKAHLRTRAAEAVLPILSVNDCSQYQTAPTAAFDNDGNVISELPRNREGLLVYDLERKELSFSARGRKTVADALLKMK
jgi:predicted amidohydrolase